MYKNLQKSRMIAKFLIISDGRVAAMVYPRGESGCRRQLAAVVVGVLVDAWTAAAKSRAGGLRRADKAVGATGAD